MSRDAEIAIAAAHAGAEALRARYGGPLTRFAKTGLDFATEADLEAEQAVRDVILAACPDDAFLGEEGGLTGAADSGRTWLVDPLCGTLNFAARTPLAAVNVALRRGDQITAAAVADLLTGEIAWTAGDGGFVRGAGEADDRLVPSPLSRLVDVDFDERPTWAAALVSAEDFVTRFGTRVSSTTLALAWVASGRRAAYVHAGHVRDSVHFAAGIAICEAAGCVVTDLSGRPIRAADSRGLVAAADQDTHEALLAVIGTLRSPDREK